MTDESEPKEIDPIEKKLREDILDWVGIRDTARKDFDPTTQRAAIRMIHVIEQALFHHSKGQLK